MTNRILHTLACLLVSGVSWAQSTSADAYFNQAARQYVKEDKLSALRTLDKGLKAYPGDARMLQLAEELLKQQQQQSQQQQQQAQQEQQQREQQQRDQQQQQGQQEQQAQQQQGERKKGSGEQEAGRIAPKDAERILDALERQEQGTQDKVRARMRPVQRRRIEKDW